MRERVVECEALLRTEYPVLVRPGSARLALILAGLRALISAGFERGHLIKAVRIAVEQNPKGC